MMATSPAPADVSASAAAIAARGRPARLRHLFTARLPDSLVGLSLPARRPHAGPAAAGRVTLDAATALYEAERWLPALEDWLASGLVPQLTSITEPLAESLMFTQHVLLSHPGLDAQVHLPISALKALRTPPPAAFSPWTWQPLRSELVLDTLPLSAADLRSIEPGALVLLPASFSTTSWSAALQPVSGHGGVFAARLYEARGRLCAAATGEAGGTAPNDHATLRFRRPIDVPPADLFGWSGGKPAALDAPELLAAGAVMVHASAVMKSRPLASGQLIPVGSGFAVRIDALAGPAGHPDRP